MAEFKEFERWFKYKPRLKYGWFHLKLYVSRFKPALNLNRVLADLNCGSNPLNSISGHVHLKLNLLLSILLNKYSWKNSQGLLRESIQPLDHY